VDNVRKLDNSDPLTWEFLEEKLRHFDDDTLVLTGFNVTRVKMNEHIRNLLGYAGEPKVGERVICLKNNHQRQVFNGMTGTILAIDRIKERGGDYYKAEVLLDGEEGIYEGDLSVDQFGEKSTSTTERRSGIDLFDFGYALTVHKAQGSQAKRVILLSERSSHMDDSM
jgi:exodeoxyribonuclease-5